jgi:endonuclease G
VIEEGKSSKPGTFAGRDGYIRDFLGVPMLPPALGDWDEHRLAETISDDNGMKTNELRYRHFSIWMSASRLLPLMTAVNIDGGQAKRLGRGDWWFVDHRLDAARQIDNSGYKNNSLDRGHMVRREDPVWGGLSEAEQANRDTFAYTNAAPQHEGLNQKDWLALEDYILGNARTRDLKVSVFTGPVLDGNDPVYAPPEGGVTEFQIPLAFWKIACVINAETGKPSVTGYILTQGSLIRRMIDEFAYGGFMTYQVPLRMIGEVTGLDLRHLQSFDPLDHGKPVAESVITPLRGPGDIVL